MRRRTRRGSGEAHLNVCAYAQSAFEKKVLWIKHECIDAAVLPRHDTCIKSRRPSLVQAIHLPSEPFSTVRSGCFDRRCKFASSLFTFP